MGTRIGVFLMSCWALPFMQLALPVLALGAATLAATVRRQVAR